MKKTQKGIIQRIEYSKNEHSLEFVDATIYYNDGSYEIIEGAMNVYNAIALLGRQYDLEVGEVLKKSEICKEIKTKAMITSEVSENASTRVVRRRKVNSETTRPTIRTNPSEFETTTVEEEVLEETPKKSRKPIIKGLAIFTAGILATVGTIELCRYLKDKHVEATKVPAITETMTSISRNTDLTGYNQTFNDNLNISIKDYQRLNEIMAKINNNLGIKSEEFQFLLDNVTMLCHANVTEVEKVIEGGKMSGTQYTLSFQNLFDSNSVDYFILNKFCTMRNSVVDRAYNNIKDNTKKAVKEFLDEYFDFIFNGKTHDFNARRVGYYEMTPQGRYMLTSLGQAMLTTDQSYKYKINGNEYGFNELINQLYEYYNTVTLQLETNITFSK